MKLWSQTLVALALAASTTGLSAQGGVAVGGFETDGSVGLDRAQYQAISRALTDLLGRRLGERGASQVVPLAPTAATRPGRVDVGAARQAAQAAGSKLLVVGSLLDQYGDIQIEARLINAVTGEPVAVVRGDPKLVKREQLAEALGSLADQLTGQPGVGGSPGGTGSALTIEALVQYGKALEFEAAGDRAKAADAFRAALRAAPGFAEATAGLQRVS